MRSGAGRRRLPRALHVSRGTPFDRGAGQRLFDAARDAGGPLAVEQLRELRPSDEHEVVFLRQAVAHPPKGLAQGPLDAVALDRAADLAARRDPEPQVAILLVLAGEGVEDEKSGGVRGAVAVDPVELAAARETPTPATRRRHLDGEALPAFAAPALEDRPAAAGAHPCPKSVGLGPLPLLRLVGALHPASQYTDASEKFCPGFATGPEWWRRGAAMVARGCKETPTDSSWTRSGRTF